MCQPSFPLCTLSGLLVIFWTCAGQSSVFSQEATGSKSAALTRFLDEQTLLVARADLTSLDAASLSAMLARIAPAGDTRFPSQLTRLEEQVRSLQRTLSASGIRELYCIFSLLDLPKEPYFVVAPLNPGANAASVAEILQSALKFEGGAGIEGNAVLGSAAVVERLKTLQPAARPEFARGLDRSDAPLQIVVAPSEDSRRVIRDMLPRLPEEIGGASGKTLADGFRWATLGVQFPPKTSLALTVQARDAESAAALRGMIMSASQLLVAMPEVRKRVPQADELARLFMPRLAGDQLNLTISEQNGQIEQALQALATPLQAARTSAGRMQSMNNFKQVGLALHNYHDVHGRLPPQAIRSKEGRALLSWRVAILPYLDAEELYKQFHLDEPWDSAHNKRLIEKMPAVFASPHLGDERIRGGLTSYLAPLTQRPPANPPPGPYKAKGARASAKREMVFDRLGGSKLQDITDGTSNTVLVVEANPKAATEWTRPDDLVIDDSDMTKDLRGQPDEGFCTLFGDGSARFLKVSLESEILLRLFQMNDGQPVGPIR